MPYLFLFDFLLDPSFFYFRDESVERVSIGFFYKSFLSGLFVKDKPKIKDLVWLNLRLAVVSFLRKVYPEILLI